MANIFLVQKICVFIGVYACVMVISQSTTVLITCGQFVKHHVDIMYIYFPKVGT